MRLPWITFSLHSIFIFHTKNERPTDHDAESGLRMITRWRRHATWPALYFFRVWILLAIRKEAERIIYLYIIFLSTNDAHGPCHVQCKYFAKFYKCIILLFARRITLFQLTAWISIWLSLCGASRFTSRKRTAQIEVSTADILMPFALCVCVFQLHVPLCRFVAHMYSLHIFQMAKSKKKIEINW